MFIDQNEEMFHEQSAKNPIIFEVPDGRISKIRFIHFGTTIVDSERLYITVENKDMKTQKYLSAVDLEREETLKMNYIIVRRARDCVGGNYTLK